MKSMAKDLLHVLLRSYAYGFTAEVPTLSGIQVLRMGLEVACEGWREERRRADALEERLRALTGGRKTLADRPPRKPLAWAAPASAKEREELHYPDGGESVGAVVNPEVAHAS